MSVEPVPGSGRDLRLGWRAWRSAMAALELPSVMGSALLISLGNGILKVSNAVFFILIVHGLDQDAAGRFSVATTLVAIALNLALFGLDEILVRRAAEHPDHAKVFANFLIARVGMVLISALVLDGFLVVSSLYPPELTLLVVLLSVGLLGDGVLLLAQSLFVAHNRVRLVLVTAVVVSVLRIVLGVAVIALRGGLYRLALAFIAPSLFGAALAAVSAMYGVLGARPLALLGQIDFRFAWGELRRSASFFFISVFVIVEFQADVLLLSLLRSLPEVALYNAALTLMIAAWIMPQAFRAAIYPHMARARQSSLGRFWRYFRITIGPAVALGLGVGGALALFARLLMVLIYPADYSASAAILRILALPLFFAFVSGPSTRAMLTLHRESVAALMLGVSMAVNLGANLLLIPQWGPMGAAVARAASGGAFCVLTYAYLAFLRARTPLD